MAAAVIMKMAKPWPLDFPLDFPPFACLLQSLWYLDPQPGHGSRANHFSAVQPWGISVELLR
jgi:hypothetical protein